MKPGDSSELLLTETGPFAELANPIAKYFDQTVVSHLRDGLVEYTIRLHTNRSIQIEEVSSTMSRSIEIQKLVLAVPTDDRLLGTRVFAGLMNLAKKALAALDQHRQGKPLAVVGRLRGTGRGVSLTTLLDQLDQDHPIELSSPFEGSDRVAGAVWESEKVTGEPASMSIAKLRWSNKALDLPMHIHEHSDRFIIVRKGRGYFHVSNEPADEFTGRNVRTIPARERDVFMFSRGVVHTFSTDLEPMDLVSCQSPFLSFDDPLQYRLPKVRWTADKFKDEYPVKVACDPGWMVAFNEFGAFANGWQGGKQLR